MHFGITEKPTTDCVSLYNNARLISKVSEEIASENAENYCCRQLHCRLTVDAPPQGTTANVRIKLILPESMSHWATSSSLIVWVTFIQIFVVGSERRMFSAIACSRSSKVVDFGTNRKGVYIRLPISHL